MLPKFKPSRKSTDNIPDPRNDPSRHSSSASSASSLASPSSKSNISYRKSSQSLSSGISSQNTSSGSTNYSVSPKSTSNSSRHSVTSHIASHRASIASLRNDIRSSIYSTDELHLLSTAKSRQPNEFVLERPTDDRVIEEMFKDLIVCAVHF